VRGPAHERPWDIYSGYFSDPVGHLREIIYFPGRDTPSDDRPCSNGQRPTTEPASGSLSGRPVALSSSGEVL
jgi:hypothetical protein